MKVSLNCLSQYVDIQNISPEEIANRLTFAGVEVESLSRLASGNNLVIGHILSCEKHPDSDHLHILKVDLGKEEGIKQIVCGAPNARTGLKVIVAMVGAKLIGGEIKKAAVRNVDSEGMCCSLSELGVDPKYLSEAQLKGIEELPHDAPVGEKKVLEYLGLDDAILDLKVLANRPDLLSVINVAREVGSIFDRQVTIPSFETVANIKTDFVVDSKTNKCTQFSIKEIHGLKNGESPKWMKDYLMAMGIRSINALVDIGNYVMLITGQPLHMYDLDKLPSHELIVRDDYNGPLVALDEKTYDVKTNDIVITSSHHPMCLGGVMGALKCAVDINTKNLVIESASFDGASIRRTSNRLGLASESSGRFVKGTNHFQYEYVIDFASKLIRDILGANKESDIKTYALKKEEKKVVASSTKEINKRLGTHFEHSEIEKVLERLNFIIDMNEDGEFKAIVPMYRLDINGSADLSEEVIRVLGYDNIKSELPNLEITVGKMNPNLSKSRMISDFLLSNGIDQCLTYTLVSKKEIDDFNYLVKDEPHQIINPLTDDHELARLHILPSLLDAASYNISRQIKDLRLFEISDVIGKKIHNVHLAVVLSGNEEIRHKMETRPVDFYAIKGIFEGIMNLLGIDSNRYKIERLNSLKEEFHPGKSAVIKIGNEVVGVMGELHPSEINKRNLGIKNNVVALELKLNPFFEMRTSALQMSEISKFPLVNRDLALLIDKKVEAKDLLKAIKVTGKGLVVEAEVFDVYEGKNIEDGKKSIAITISYGANDHTLNDKEITDIEGKIKAELASKFLAVLRG